MEKLIGKDRKVFIQTKDGKDNWFHLAKKYYEYHGDLEVPQRFKTLNGYVYDENGEALGMWIANQRQDYKNNTLSDEKIQKLEAIGMRFQTMSNEEQWNKMFQLSKKYYEYHGHLEIPARFKTLNGYVYDENGEALGNWITTQRQNYKNNTLSEDKIQKLEVIGMRFQSNFNEEQWNKMFQLSKKYYEHYGNLEVLTIFKTLNGYEYHESGKALGMWISNQRQNYKNNTLSDEKIQKLEAIGMRFQTISNEEKWNKLFHLAKKYYEYHSNLEVPYNFKTLNGYESHENGEALGSWIANQRQYYKKNILSNEKIQKLEAIGMRFQTISNEEKWNKMFQISKKYYEYHGHFEVPYNFKTLNGYEYDESGETLGIWIVTQRQNYKKNILSDEKIQKLEAIGMIWEIRKNKKQIEKICQEFSIDYEKNKLTLEHISYQELVAKINYLNANNISLMNNGVLHEIFSLSGIHMEVKYGISLKNMISEYYVASNIKGV